MPPQQSFSRTLWATKEGLRQVATYEHVDDTAGSSYSTGCIVCLTIFSVIFFVTVVVTLDL